MLSRALSLATVTLLIGCFAAGAAYAQATNLEAGKSPSQIFAGTCTACHKSPRGLLKNVPASSLPGFLRQHYTTSSDMASVLSSFLVSNGAADTRYQGKDQPKQAKDAKQDGKPVQEARPGGPPDQLDRFGRRLRPAPSSQEAARPDADGVSPQVEPGRPGRDAKRLARPGETPEGAKPGEGLANDVKMGAKQKLSKRGKPAVEEPPKPVEAAKGEAAKDDASKSQTAKSDAANDAVKDAVKDDADKPEAAKPAGEAKSETAKVDAPKESVKDPAKEPGGETTALRPDPVPPVTPAPAASTTTATVTPESGANPTPAAPSAAPPMPPAVTASTPPLPPVAPAGPPAPPISQ